MAPFGQYQTSSLATIVIPQPDDGTAHLQVMGASSPVTGLLVVAQTHCTVAGGVDGAGLALFVAHAHIVRHAVQYVARSSLE